MLLRLHLLDGSMLNQWGQGRWKLLFPSREILCHQSASSRNGTILHMLTCRQWEASCTHASSYHRMYFAEQLNFSWGKKWMDFSYSVLEFRVQKVNNDRNPLPACQWWSIKGRAGFMCIALAKATWVGIASLVVHMLVITERSLTPSTSPRNYVLWSAPLSTIHGKMTRWHCQWVMIGKRQKWRPGSMRCMEPPGRRSN